MKILSISILLLLSLGGYAQEGKSLSPYIGVVFHASDVNTTSTHGIGVYIESALKEKESWRLMTRVQLHALAHGVAAIEGGKLKSGANFLLINHLMVDHLLESDNRRALFYLGLDLSLLTQNRHSFSPGDLESTQNLIFDVASGPRAGIQSGRVDLNMSFNFTRARFTNYMTFGLGYRM